ncbi:hypothetical protein HAX54_003042 [Datura stramonium]|uniref:Uncharacterized protein n=1 Tax=Datura stramonium TaxID=4076 RepID=A0ABS8WVR4_DATST|nr:hypothetical protein [Datura stramonium]
MSEESVNAPIPIIDLVSDGEMEKTLREEVAKIEKRIVLTRKRLAEAEQRIANILKPSDRISGFEHHTRRSANNSKQLYQKGKGKMEASGESVGSSQNMSIVNHGFEEPYYIIFQKLIDAQLIHPIGRRRKRPLRIWETVKECPYHSGMLGDDINERRMLKFNLEHLIRVGDIRSYSRQVTAEMRIEGAERIG